MELLHKPRFQLGALLVLMGLLLDRIAVRELDSDSHRHGLWETVHIGSDLFVAIGIFVALADPHS